MRCLRPCDLPKLLSLWSSRLARRSPSLLPRCAGHRGLFVAPTLGFRLLYAFIIVRLARRIRLDQRHTSSDGGLDRTPDHGSPWQNGFAERLIGSIRRECLDHVIALGGVHLRGILQAYARYYNDLRTHRSLDKDAPFSRPVQRIGRIRSHAVLGGLHHQYMRV